MSRVRMNRMAKFTGLFFVLFNFVCIGAFVVKKRTDTSSDGLILERIIYPEENIGVVDNDLTDGDIKDSRRRNAVKDHDSLWTTRTIPIEFYQNTFTTQEKNQIRLAIEEVESHTCVRFKLRHNEPDYVIFQKRDSCSSEIGRKEGSQTIDLHFSCMSKGYIIHELMHTLGFWHEHSRPDRDDYVQVMWDNIQDGMEFNFEKKDPASVVFPGAYDYGSIMHYKVNNFAKDRSKPTLKPLQETNAFIGQRVGLSKLDAWKINTVYKCNNTACPHPGTPRHGILMATDLSIGQNVSYNCKPGYTLIGGVKRFCQDIEKWTGRLPECLAGVLHYCNFDHPDLCGWKKDRTNLMDWSWNSGGTKTSKTGPPYDHTYSFGSHGHYLYTESSSPFKTGDTARITSTILLSPMEPVCMRYYYSMYGKGMGTLNVYQIEKGSQSLIKSLSGNKGKGWQEDIITLTVQPKTEFQIMFEGIKGANWTSDMAIDDVIIGECSSISPESGTEPSSAEHTDTNLIGSCNFNHGPCSFVQDNTDDFDWTTHSGPTSSDNRICDRDDCRHGKYLYIDTSRHIAGTSARLISPLYRVHNAGPKCISFYYLIQGQDLGGLLLYLIEGTNRPYEVWHKLAERTITWEHAMVEVSPSTKFKIMFEGEINKGYQGDLAIDDVLILDGPCPYKATVIPLTTASLEQLNCDFDQDICKWSQPLATPDLWVRNNGNTATRRTGPPFDHTTGRGYYLYAEASYKPRGTTYTLLSPTIQSNTDGYCFKLWYYMYGADVGTLKILIKIPEMDDAIVWERSGEQGREWKYAAISIPGVKYDYTLAIVAVTGKGRLGDIAVDDVSIHPGHCQTLTTPASPLSSRRIRIGNQISTNVKNRGVKRKGKSRKNKRGRSKKKNSNYNSKLKSYLKRTYW